MAIEGKILIDDTTLKNTMNNAIQSAVSNTFKKSDLQDRIYSYGCKRVKDYINKFYANGSVLSHAAKQVAKEINTQDVLALIDIEELKADIADRVAKHLIEKL